MAGINFPVSKKMWTMNIAAKKAYGIGRVYPTAWTNLFANWSTDWATWIKLQIDQAAALGCKAIRVVGSIGGVHATTYTQAHYNACWQQLVEYCGVIGMAVIVCCGWPPQLASGATTNYDTGDGAGMTNQNIADSVLALDAALASYSNISHIEVLQEIESWRDESITANWDTQVNAIYGLIKPNTTRLLTFSSASQTLQSAGCKSALALIAGSLDILDFHIYSEMIGYDATTPITVADLDYWLTTYASKDILFSEFGMSQNKTYDQIATYFACIINVIKSGNPRYRGGGMWAAADGDDSAPNEWGLTDAAFTVLRPARANLLRQATGGCIAERH